MLNDEPPDSLKFCSIKPMISEWKTVKEKKKEKKERERERKKEKNGTENIHFYIKPFSENVVCVASKYL